MGNHVIVNIFKSATLIYIFVQGRTIMDTIIHEIISTSPPKVRKNEGNPNERVWLRKCNHGTPLACCYLRFKEPRTLQGICTLDL